MKRATYFTMHKTIRNAIIQTVTQCLYDKAMIAVEQARPGEGLMTPAEYRGYQRTICQSIYAMNEDHVVTVINERGEISEVKVDIDRILEVFDPLPN